MPMQRWMARAAGGSSHRLKPGPAMVRSFDSQPPEEGVAAVPFVTVDILILLYDLRASIVLVPTPTICPTLSIGGGALQYAIERLKTNPRSERFHRILRPIRPRV